MQGIYKSGKNGHLLLPILIKANASKNQIQGVVNGRLKISITAVAVDGQANESLVKFLAKYFGIGSTKIKIIKGDHCSQKILEIPCTITPMLDKLLSIL